MKAQAASKHRLAQSECEAAMRLENDAARLGRRAGSLEHQADHSARVSDTIGSSPVVPPKAALRYVEAGARAGAKAGAADQLEGELVVLRRQAAEKRANASRLMGEAAQLEVAARSIEFGAGSGRDVSR